MECLLPNSRLAVLAGNHGGYMGEAMTPDASEVEVKRFVSKVDEFLSDELLG